MPHEEPMMNPDLSADPPRDPRLARALREASPDAPLDRVDWDRLHRAVDQRAALLMARRRQPWWAYAAHWSRAAIPVAAAAGLALFALIATTRAQDDPARVTSAPVMEEALSTGISDTDRSLLSDDGGDWLLRTALPAPEER
jgi:hypothetical protein